MEEFSIDRRTVLRGVAGAGAAAVLPSTTAVAEMAEETDPTTRATYKAIVDAVVPETDDLDDKFGDGTLGDQHDPGGLQIGLQDYLIGYVNTLFSIWDAPDTWAAIAEEVSGEGPGEGSVDISTDVELDERREWNGRLTEAVAKTCDVAATELLARQGNKQQPDPTRFDGGGPFASLSRMDRLRALALLDEKSFDTAELPGPVVEGTAALIPQLLVAFPEVIYYSEWQGYEDLWAPPSEREFSETVDGEKLQSWQQTDFPGIIDGSVSFRGYWGDPDSSLGDGDPWTGASWEYDSERIFLEPGEFRENTDYESYDEEPFDTSGEAPNDLPVDVPEVQRPEDAEAAARDGMDEDLLERAREFIGGGDTGSGGIGGGL